MHSRTLSRISSSTIRPTFSHPMKGNNVTDHSDVQTPEDLDATILLFDETVSDEDRDAAMLATKIGGILMARSDELEPPDGWSYVRIGFILRHPDRMIDMRVEGKQTSAGPMFTVEFTPVPRRGRIN